MSRTLRTHCASGAYSGTQLTDKGNRSALAGLHRWALVGAVLLATTGCEQGSNPWLTSSAEAPAQPTQSTMAVRDKAAMCGRSLGVGVRCNMLQNEGDFAIVRYLALDGLRNQSAPGTDFTEIETAFDLGTLEMINTVGTCQATPTELAALEKQIKTQLATCKAG